MRKLWFSIFVIFLICFSGFSSSYDEDPRTLAMGSIGTSGFGSDLTYFSNPASITYFNQANKFMFQTEYSDFHSKKSDLFFQEPSLYFKGQFVGKGIAFTLGADTYISGFEREDNKNRICTSFRRFDFAMSLAYRLGDLSVGTTIQGGSFLQKTNVKVNGEVAFSDLLFNGFFAKHSRLRNSEFVNIRLGLMYKLSGFTFSFKSKELLCYEGSATTLSTEKALDTMDFGIYYDSDQYGKRGRLKSWVFSGGVECKNLLDKELRSLHGGLEVRLQLSKGYSFSFRGGYQTYVNNLSNGFVCAGLGIRTGKFDISAVGIVPISEYSENNNGYKIGIDFTVLI